MAQRLFKEAAIRVPELVFIYWLYKQSRKGKTNVSELATLSKEKAITLKSASMQNREQYNETLARKVSKACDFTNPTVNTFANKIAGKYGREGKFNITQVAALFEHMKNNWDYVNDPSGIDNLERASEVVASGLSSDCDAFASLLCSSILAIGGTARWNAGFSDKGGHAWVDVYVGKNKLDFEKQKNDLLNSFRIIGLKDVFQEFWGYIKGKGYNINYVEDKTGYYIPADWWAGHLGGPLFPGLKYWLTIWPKSGEHKVLRDEL